MSLSFFFQSATVSDGGKSYIFYYFYCHFQIVKIYLPFNVLGKDVFSAFPSWECFSWSWAEEASFLVA